MNSLVAKHLAEMGVGKVLICNRTRARREAIVRLKLEAEKMGATHIMGLRLSTTELGMQGGMVEVFAYGTAILS